MNFDMGLKYMKLHILCKSYLNTSYNNPVNFSAVYVIITIQYFAILSSMYEKRKAEWR
jgi:hypothetical protein